MTLQMEQSDRRWNRFCPKSKIFKGPVSVIALINVALLIASFMALKFVLARKPGVMVELPEAEFVYGSRYGDLVVTLTQEGTVFFNDERMPMEALVGAFKKAAHGKQNLSLIIEADARVPYGNVMQVMNMATAAQIHQVDLATRPLPAQQQILEIFDDKQ